MLAEARAEAEEGWMKGQQREWKWDVGNGDTRALGRVVVPTSTCAVFLFNIVELIKGEAGGAGVIDRGDRRMEGGVG
jgi:hypothetical protein